MQKEKLSKEFFKINNTVSATNKLMEILIQDSENYEEFTQDLEFFRDTYKEYGFYNNLTIYILDQIDRLGEDFPCTNAEISGILNEINVLGEDFPCTSDQVSGIFE